MTVRDERVLAVNQAFYLAMRQGDLAAMDALWSRAREVSCTHPGRPMLIGRVEIMDSWRAILGQGTAPEIRCVDPVACVFRGTAFVLCEERVMGARLLAINSFALEPRGNIWRMIGHHASELP
ncbi:MAG: nuclear transport factor 2 family protein [Pikeienuella sp.]